MVTAKPSFAERKKKVVKMTQLISTGHVCWELWMVNRATTSVYCAPKCPSDEGYGEGAIKRSEKQKTNQMTPT